MSGVQRAIFAAWNLLGCSQAIERLLEKVANHMKLGIAALVGVVLPLLGIIYLVSKC